MDLDFGVDLEMDLDFGIDLEIDLDFDLDFVFGNVLGLVSSLVSEGKTCLLTV